MHIVKSLKRVWDWHCCLDNKSFCFLNCLLLWTICLQSFTDYNKLLIKYSRFHNLLIDIQTCWRHKCRRFRQSFDDSPILLNHFWCHFTLLWTLISLELGKILRQGQQFSFQLSMYFHVKKNFHHYIFIISQLWLTSHPRSTVVLLDTGTPGTSRQIYSEDADGETRTRSPWITNPVL